LDDDSGDDVAVEGKLPPVSQEDSFVVVEAVRTVGEVETFQFGEFSFDPELNFEPHNVPTECALALMFWLLVFPNFTTTVTTVVGLLYLWEFTEDSVSTDEDKFIFGTGSL
jgi:hypothetical protein